MIYSPARGFEFAVAQSIAAAGSRDSTRVESYTASGQVRQRPHLHASQLECPKLTATNRTNKMSSLSPFRSLSKLALGEHTHTLTLDEEAAASGLIYG